MVDAVSFPLCKALSVPQLVFKCFINPINYYLYMITSLTCGNTWEHIVKTAGNQLSDLHLGVFYAQQKFYNVFCSENMGTKFGNPNLEAPFLHHDFKSRVEPIGGQNELDLLLKDQNITFAMYCKNEHQNVFY